MMNSALKGSMVDSDISLHLIVSRFSVVKNILFVVILMGLQRTDERGG